MKGFDSEAHLLQYKAGEILEVLDQKKGPGFRWTVKRENGQVGGESLASPTMIVSH